MSSSQIDVLLIRMDRIGDLLLNLPVDQHEFTINKKVHWFINKNLGFILDLAEPRRQYTEFSTDPSELDEMISRIKTLSPKVAIVFHAPWWVGKALKKAGVPVRMGRYSQWHSFLYFNYGIRQKRSLAEKSERDYNFELLEKCFFKYENALSDYDFTNVYTPLKNNEDHNVLASLNLMPKNYFVVHPGMRGSALNWPSEYYAELIKKMVKSHEVIITGTEDDWPYLEPVYRLLSGVGNIKWLNGKLSAVDLVAVLQNAKAVVAPSTGVVHIAASSGAPTIGLYPPIKVQAKKRWGAIGDNVVNLEATPGEKIEESMKNLTVDTVFSELEKLL